MLGEDYGWGGVLLSCDCLASAIKAWCLCVTKKGVIRGVACTYLI